MKAFTTVVTAISGLGTQTITGVVDSQGHAFTPQAYFIVGNSALNTLEYSTGSLVPGWRLSFGMDNGVAFWRGTATEDTVQSGGKISDTGASSGYSILDEKAQTAFGGAIERKAFISAASSGQFEIQYDVNVRTGDSFIVTVLGGSDLSWAMASSVNPISGLSFAPVAVIGMSANNSSTGTGTGTTNLIYGWDTPSSGRGFAITGALNQGGNFRGQRSDHWLGLQTGVYPTLTYTGLSDVSTWDSGGIHISGAVPGSATLLVGGTSILAAAGTLTQPNTIGVQETVVGFMPAVVFLLSTGMEADTAVQIDQAELAAGFMDGTRQTSYWTGETTIGNVGSVNGARYLSDDTVLRFGAANGASTTFDAVAEDAGFSSLNGSFSLNWTTVDSVDREVLWLALGPGEAVTPPETVVYPIRRLRRFEIAYDRHLQQFLRRIEFYCQPGTGLVTGQGSDPTLMFRLSKDGGITWGTEQTMSIGAMGEYTKRAYLIGLGQGRHLVGEISCSDPTTFALIDCLADLDGGTS